MPLWIFDVIATVRTNSLDPGFVKTTPQTLPVLKVMSTIEYIQGSGSCVAAEFRNKKLKRWDDAKVSLSDLRSKPSVVERADSMKEKLLLGVLKRIFLQLGTKQFFLVLPGTMLFDIPI